MTRLISCLKYASTFNNSEKISFFIVDDFVFSKKKHKKTKGVGLNYCGASHKVKRSQCVVSSSCLIGDYHFIFKSLFYVGKKFTSLKKFQTKTKLAVNLFSKFEKFMTKYHNSVNSCIALLDGGYTNEATMTSIIKSSYFKGFIGRFNIGRKLYFSEKSIKLKEYLKTLTLNDFKIIDVNGVKKYAHEILCCVNKSISVKIVLVIDDIKNPHIKDSRPLITNIRDLSAEQIIDFYSKRWREETYHQILKDAFFARTHKLRSLKALARFMEGIAVAHEVCEKRRLQQAYEGIFDIKNDLISIANRNFILNLKGNKIKKPLWNKLILKFAA